MKLATPPSPTATLTKAKPTGVPASPAPDPIAIHPALAALLRATNASPDQPPSPEAWRAMLAGMSEMCASADRERAALHHSMATSAHDTQQQYQDLKRRTDSERVELDAVLRATLESTVEGVCVVDNGWRVIAVNRRFAELARLPESALEIRDQRTLVSAALHIVKNSDEVMRHVHALHDTDMTTREELELIDGSFVDWFSAPVRTPDGAKVGRVAFLRDVTAERVARRELEQAREAAEAASQAKSMFLANMSHELRTPLNAVIGLADLIMLERDPLVDRQREYLNGIASSGRHLLALVNDVLDLAKIEAGKQELALQPIRIHEAIEEGMAAILPLAKSRGVMLEPATIVAVPPVRADATRLRQILYNLISNAVKFTNRHGTVRIRARRDGDRVSIAVKDTGIGIAPADLSRLYRTFEQLTLPSGDRPAGTGLGLALTKRLVEMHGGTIDVVSELGVGTTFTVKIPVA
jgi:PAS domain S-box-containing protein